MLQKMDAEIQWVLVCHCCLLGDLASLSTFRIFNYVFQFLCTNVITVVLKNKIVLSWIPVDNYKISDAFVMNVVGIYTLKWVNKIYERNWWCRWLRRNHAITFFSRRTVMSDMISGQKTDNSALDVIEETPWWAKCKSSKTVDLRAGSMMILSFDKATPSSV